MQKRPRVKQTRSLQDRLSGFLYRERTQGESSPAGRQEFWRKVRQAEIAANIANIERWANSPELQPPR